MKKRIRIRLSGTLSLVLFFFPVMAAEAADVDYSCMNYKVWDKEHSSNQYKDTDVVLQNRCPGSVYWSMCIERVDPWTGKILETHDLVGFIEAEKKARVNLHLQKSKNRTQFRNRFQEFYVSFGYGIKKHTRAVCTARQCENKKQGLREQIRANETAWQRAENSMTAQIAAECPDPGWDPTNHQECATRIREASHGKMNAYPLKDQELREKMSAVDPERCQAWSGELSGS